MRDYRNQQQQAFSKLIGQGVYSNRFQHDPDAQKFFEDAMRHALSLIPSSDETSILDCGCGTGDWLEFFHNTQGGKHIFQYFGFDLTPGMIDLARQRLAAHVPADHLHPGDILNEPSYVFGTPDQTFDVIYTYDVIQQLPGDMQFQACLTLLKKLAPGGVAVIFDHDRQSWYGIKMGFKKFVTKYLRLRLVPDYYCLGRYPPLAWFARWITARKAYTTEIRIAPDGKKRALIVRSHRPV